MEFLDEDAKPRFVLQSKTLNGQSTTIDDHHNQTLSKPFLFLTLSLSLTLLVLSLLFVHSEPSKSLLLWLSLSVLLGPFAPPSLTAGDVRVGRGPAVEPLVADDGPPPPEKKLKPKVRRSAERVEAPAMAEFETLGERNEDSKQEEKEDGVWEEKEWRDEEVEVLKKQLAKNPAGKPGRWEAVAESFRGRHGVESVIRKAKELGERRPGGGDDDSYSEFLKRRKPADKRFLAEQGSGDGDLNLKAEELWSSAEDIALLNALKAFPKEATMRWEKVAAAVPGKSKAACVKRVAELKKGFRSTKKAAAAAAEEEG